MNVTASMDKTVELTDGIRVVVGRLGEFSGGQVPSRAYCRSRMATDGEV